ncbi:hypothetical protein FRC12_010961 [Ceratobasidium sp. 428]|nr:hypothetical protein FRC12_010961 [Ceratobasidium sp. 428]
MQFYTLLNFLLTLLCLFSAGLSSPTPATGAAGDAAPDALVKREPSLIAYLAARNRSFVVRSEAESTAAPSCLLGMVLRFDRFRLHAMHNSRWRIP